MEPENLAAIRRSQDFYTFCCQNWHSRSLTDNLLRLRVDGAALKAMTPKAKLDLVYQTGVEYEYADVADSRAAQKEFRSAMV